MAAALLLALPGLAVHAWMAATFPTYLHSHFGQDLVFTCALCGLLVAVARLRLLHLLSVPVALIAYLAWLFLVFGEGVSYYLQADTFNARFFAHLNPANLRAGLHAFPVMIGGGLVVFGVMLVVCVALLWWLARSGRSGNARCTGPAIVVLVILLLCVLGVDSAPRRLTRYLTRVRQSTHFADTPQGRAVARLLDLHPVPLKRVVAAPGKNLVMIYMESLERQFWDPRLYPGLTPNLDRLRKQGLDFSGFQTFTGATYTMAGIFASQCGVPLFTSPFAGIEALAGNATDAATFQPKIVCLGDVLHRAGYTQIYLGGAPIDFSNKGLFFRLHGYNQALGLHELEAEAHDKLPESGWGLYDSELFKLALARYQQLEAAHKPFNLSMLTLDTHPPNGRPSPGCPKYAANQNSMLQAVHCTDFLVGKFIDALSAEPDWKNTVVLIMSDHLMMRNVAEPLFPKHYLRQPSLLILNAGRGERPATMYHMDIAPTLLDLMDVRTNATFIAGRDRSAPDSAGSELVDNGVTDAVLRKALWSRVNEFKLCKKNTLIGWIDGDFEIGGRELKMSLLGRPAVGIHSGQALDFFIDNANAKLVIADAGQQARALMSRGDASVLMISHISQDKQSQNLFSVDWVGHDGAHAHIADVARLDGLTIKSPHCAELMAKADQTPAGVKLDLSHDFTAVTSPLPEPPGVDRPVDFTQPAAVAYESGLGWLPPETWGSYTIGPAAVFGFRLPSDLCRAGATLHMQLDPYLPPSRPWLDTRVVVNGKLATTWQFKAGVAPPTSNQAGSDNHAIIGVSAPIGPGGATCDAHVELQFVRPPHKGKYPASEDKRDLQLRIMRFRVTPSPASARTR